MRSAARESSEAGRGAIQARVFSGFVGSAAGKAEADDSRKAEGGEADECEDGDRGDEGGDEHEDGGGCGAQDGGDEAEEDLDDGQRGPPRDGPVLSWGWSRGFDACTPV